MSAMGTPAVISIDDNLATPDDEDYGYIVEINMDYHEHLHAHCDYPLPLETMTVHESILLDYQHHLVNIVVGKYVKCKNLVFNLRPKEKYVLHYRNLKFYKSQGLIITKIHRTIKFKQSSWMAPYLV